MGEFLWQTSGMLALTDVDDNVKLMIPWKGASAGRLWNHGSLELATPVMLVLREFLDSAAVKEEESPDTGQDIFIRDIREVALLYAQNGTLTPMGGL